MYTWDAIAYVTDVYDWHFKEQMSIPLFIFPFFLVYKGKDS